jgi:hypothetical protein
VIKDYFVQVMFHSVISMTLPWGFVSSGCMVTISLQVSFLNEQEAGYYLRFTKIDFCDDNLIAGAFKQFETDGEFCCFPRESNRSVTCAYSLYRASQVAFPGEDLLGRTEKFSRDFLHDRRASHNLKDKWLIPKDLTGEVPNISTNITTLPSCQILAIGIE